MTSSIPRAQGPLYAEHLLVANNVTTFNDTTFSGTSTSTSYATVTSGPSVTVHKYLSDTVLIVSMACSYSVPTNNPTTVEVGLSINGTDYMIIRSISTTNNARLTATGLGVEIPGLAAGIYTGIVVRFRRVSGTGTVTFTNSDDYVSGEILEAFPT